MDDLPRSKGLFGLTRLPAEFAEIIGRCAWPLAYAPWLMRGIVYSYHDNEDVEDRPAGLGWYAGRTSVL